MKKILIYIMLLMGFVNLCEAQQTKITLAADRKTDNCVDINFTKLDFGSYFLILTLNQLTNCYESPIQKMNISGYNGKVITLKPANAENGISYGYSYRYIMGSDRYKPNNFVYLLPFKEETKIKVYESNYLWASYFGKETPKDWKCYKFYTDNESVVTAARKGTVVFVKDIFELDSLKAYAYKDQNNEVTIEHADGSFARYSGFKKGSITVKEGQIVYPETVLGMNSKYSANDENYGLSFYIFYLKANDFADSEATNSRAFYGFVTPLMYTKTGDVILTPKQDYEVVSTPEIITKEMTKKELKNFKN